MKRMHEQDLGMKVMQDYGRKVMRWLVATNKRIAASRMEPDWQIEGIRRSLRLTLSWLCQGRTLYEASPQAYLCVMTPRGRTEIRHQQTRFEQLPMGLHLGQAGILMSPGEALLVDQGLLAGLLQERMTNYDSPELLNVMEETRKRVRPISSLIPPGAGFLPEEPEENAA